LINLCSIDKLKHWSLFDDNHADVIDYYIMKNQIDLNIKIRFLVEIWEHQFFPNFVFYFIQCWLVVSLQRWNIWTYIGRLYLSVGFETNMWNKWYDRNCAILLVIHQISGCFIDLGIGEYCTQHTILLSHI